MKNPRRKPLKLCTEVASLCLLPGVVLLSACGDMPGILQTGTSSQPTPSASAAQLANDDATSLSVAHAIGAGVIPMTAQVSTNDDLLLGSNSTAASIAAVAAAAGNTATGTQATGNGGENTSGSSVPTSSQPEPVETNNEPVNTSSEPVATTNGNASGTTNTSNSNSIADALAQQGSVTTPDNNEPTEVPIGNTSQDNTAQAGQQQTDTPVPAPVPQTSFSSHTTAGFTGEVNGDGSITVRWQKNDTARGYNVYRQAQYITTVFTEEYIDTDTYDESYYYEIQAFDHSDNFNYIATGLTVEVSGTGRSNPDAPAVLDGVPDGYELVFSDEFNGNSLDASKWVTQYLWGPDLVINSEEQYYVDILNNPDFGYNPFTFDGESITINSIRTPEHLLQVANGQAYLSGLITSYDAFKFTYGYVEARVQLPYGQGLWPAFWLLNAYYVDDKPEIDIMEFIGDNQDVVYHTYHYYDSDGTLHSTESEPTVGIDFSRGYHTFAVEWRPGQLIYYVDGVERHRVNDPKVSSQEMYILANTALGGWWPGSPDNTTPFPAQYKIDYIRAYQKPDAFSGTQILNDGATSVPPAAEVPNSSPNHIPPFELWPSAYPERL